ncbi:hypothetical protein DFS34DRAFT_683431 [Phlyctochytrium arcticum]|nr:hypothetical protein DFS34DRAFT_683431 [Phlyctochytrium arcticum]
MVTDNPEQNPYDLLHDGLKKLRLQNDDLEARMEKIQAENIVLRTKTIELEAMLAAKLIEDLQSTSIAPKHREHDLILPAMLKEFDCTTGFLFQIRRYFRMHPTRYPDDASQIDLLVSLLCGKVLNFVAKLLELEMVELQNFSNLGETIELISDREAERGLSWIKQENESIDEWATKIKRLEPFLKVCCRHEPARQRHRLGLDDTKKWLPNGAFYHGLKPEYRKWAKLEDEVWRNVQAIEYSNLQLYDRCIDVWGKIFSSELCLIKSKKYLESNTCVLSDTVHHIHIHTIYR